MPAAEPLTITDAAPLLRAGQLTPSDLLEQCLVRIDRYEPHVKAWVYLDRERARQEAAQLTDEIKKGQYRGPLHGIPVGIKDIIDVFDMPTGCGSKLWANSYARRDATCVERLRQAGALILGKTMTTPYAYLDPPPTRNPWNLDRTPGGSSSGSAAAVACGMCLAALGTQTGGSLTRPASYCGVYSLKPTYDTVSRFGALPLAPGLDHVGVMANSVRDLAILFQSLVGGVGADGWLQDTPRIPDCLTAIDTRDLRPRLAQLHGLFKENAEPEALSAVAEFRRLCADASDPYGFDIKDVVPPASFNGILRDHLTVMSVQAAEVHSKRLLRHPEDYPPRITELIREGLQHTATDYCAVLERRSFLFAEVDTILRRGPIWLTPAATGPAPGVGSTGRAVMNSPWSYIRVPTVSLPVSRASDGLPLAIQLIAGERQEDRLLAAAAVCEAIARFDRRLPPVPG